MTRVALVLALGLALTGPAQSKEPGSVFIHMKISMKHDDNPACVAFNIAWAALEAGDAVTIVYDAGAVFDLQNASAGSKSKTSSQPTAGGYAPDAPYTLRYALPPKLRAILAQQLKVPEAQVPTSYYAYLKMLKERGARVLFNGAMAHLVSLTDSVMGRERVTRLASPIGLKEMLELRRRATTCFVY